MPAVKLQTKFFLAILAVFLLLSMVVVVISLNWINTNTIKEAQHRVDLHIRAARDIYEEKRIQIRSSLDILAQSSQIRSILKDGSDFIDLLPIRNDWQNIREKSGMDVLTLLDCSGTVLFRSRPPFNSGDDLSQDLQITHVLKSMQPCERDVLLTADRLEIEGAGLKEQCLKFGGEPLGMLTGSAVPVLDHGDLIGIIQMGTLLNGATATVDKIRDGVFEDERFNGKPIGTATIFMGDLRISTNVVRDDGTRAVGTRVSQEVNEHVLVNGLPWTGKAWVVNAWYLSRYDPILDPNNNVIGMLYIGELEEKYLHMRTQTVVSFLIIIVMGMFLAISITYLIIRGILVPIKELSLATQKISQGDYNLNLEVRHRDEVGNLAGSFNLMSLQLRKQQERIQQKQKELEAINSELVTTNRNYMDMLGFVAHELKNPLASAIMSLHTVKDGYLGTINEPQTKSLGLVAKSLDYFKDMIRNYLDLSRLEKGEFKVYKKELKLLRDVIDPILKGLSREMEQKKIRIENHISPEAKVYADQDLLRIVYDNLLTNAIKYGYEDGKICLDFEEQNNQVLLSVFNEGPGISKDDIGRLFCKFCRLDNPANSGKKGTGLGLFICREIMAKQSGKIWAESREGAWAKFLVSLPIFKEKENAN